MQPFLSNFSKIQVLKLISFLRITTQLQELFSKFMCLYPFSLCFKTLFNKKSSSAYYFLRRPILNIISFASICNYSFKFLVLIFFIRFSFLHSHFFSESLSVQCFHWVLTRMQHDMDMIVSDKKQARLWAKRLHVALLVSAKKLMLLK